MWRLSSHSHKTSLYVYFLDVSSSLSANHNRKRHRRNRKPNVCTNVDPQLHGCIIIREGGRPTVLRVIKLLVRSHFLPVTLWLSIYYGGLSCSTLCYLRYCSGASKKHQGITKNYQIWDLSEATLYINLDSWRIRKGFTLDHCIVASSRSSTWADKAHQW